MKSIRRIVPCSDLDLIDGSRHDVNDSINLSLSAQLINLKIAMVTVLGLIERYMVSTMRY